MPFSIAPLLIHDENVPLAAREALRVVSLSPTGDRCAQLERAARVLHHETDLDCRDARELVGLPAHGCCEA